MEKVYPNDADLHFLLCEYIRPEPGNKLTLLGVFTGGDIHFPKSAETSMTSLTLLFIFANGVGTFKTSFELLDPDGATVIQHTWDEMPTQGGQKMNLIIQVAPFKAKLGTYMAKVKLDDSAYARQFSVKVQP